MRQVLPMALAAALCAGVGGCKSDNGFGKLEDSWPDSERLEDQPVVNEDRIVQVTTPQVDVLWVIDDSGSMYDEQRKLTESFGDFIAFFLGSGLDYHIGVASTDMAAPNKSGLLQSGLNHDFIDADTPSPVDVFEAMASLGTNGSGTEKGLHAAFAALELEEASNEGFYRAEGALHTVAISDENDQTRAADISLNEFISWYDGLKPEKEDRTFSAIVHIDAPIPPLEEKGSRYLTVVEAIGGIRYDIKEDNYEVVLEQLGAEAAGLKREFFLSKLPVVSTIDVEVHNQGVVDRKDRSEWTYDGTKNSITFVSYVPDALAEVVIIYDELASSGEALEDSDR